MELAGAGDMDIARRVSERVRANQPPLARCTFGADFGDHGLVL